MKGNQPLLFLAGMGMELSWRYAWANFLTVSILHQPFPYPEAIGTFVLAALLTSLHHERGWRVISVLCLQMLGFIPAALRIIHIFNSWPDSFLGYTYKTYTGSLDQQGVPIEGYIVLLIIFWAFFFWGGGVSTAKRPRDYFTICARFDLGIGAFFFLFLVKLYLLTTGGSKINDPASESLIFSFFMFALSAIGLAQCGSTEAKNFLPGYRGLGVILSFILIIVLLGGGLVFFGLPYLTVAAKAGYGIFKRASGLVLSILMKLIRLFFGDNFSTMKEELPPVKKMAHEVTQGPISWWLQLLGEILFWAVIILLVLLLLAIFSAFAFWLFQWLFSKTPTGQKKPLPWDILRLWAVKLRLSLRSWRSTMLRRCKGYEGVVQLYSALLGWGRRSGLPHFICETPNEYSLRLKDRFPSLKNEIELIVEAFNKEVYGEISHDEQQLATTRVAFRRLCSPSLWFPRVKTWFHRPLDHGGASP